MSSAIPDRGIPMVELTQIHLASLLQRHVERIEPITLFGHLQVVGAIGDNYISLRFFPATGIVALIGNEGLARALAPLLDQHITSTIPGAAYAGFIHHGYHLPDPHGHYSWHV